MKRLLLTLTALLTACATTTSPPTLTANPNTPVLTEKKRPASALTQWQLKGLLGARTPKKGFSAQVVWRQEGPSHYQIRLYGPMGGGSATINKSGGAVTYQDANKKVQSKNASDLMKKQTGLAVPVESLYYWVRGIPAPGSMQGAQYDAQKNLLALRQNGYELTFEDYRQVNGYVLPSKIKLVGPTLTVKLIIKAWNV